MSFDNKTIVVTGANRGIGLEWVKQLAARPGTTIIATARDPAAAGALKQVGPNVKVLKLEVASESSINAFVEELASTVKHIDVVVLNAGVAPVAGLGDVTYESLVETYKVNTVGPLLLAQGLHAKGLVGGAQGPSLLVFTSTVLASIDLNRRGGPLGDFSGKFYAYRGSKTALNAIVRSLAYDLFDEGVTSVALHPGLVATDMLRDGTGLTVADDGVISPTESVAGMIKVIEKGENLQGSFRSYDGAEFPW